jgi:predicted NUDIX family NTP pyrophosphohydrolase
MPAKAKAARQSAGLLPYRFTDDRLEVFLIHPGGPFWRNKDDGAWSIAKGEYDENEDALAAARREFAEETGTVPHGDFRALGEVKQKGGKIVQAWAVALDIDAGAISSNSFALEWPPKSGKMQDFPEADRAAWFGMEEARRKILSSQAPFLDTLEKLLGAS